MVHACMHVFCSSDVSDEENSSESEMEFSDTTINGYVSDCSILIPY